ncbi:MAG TPA: BadF/BadG/BcrA/BcrD ATPase family protein [Acidobacteriota bacterium]|jgi:N-acetylglucosamine kinase-like BadF-type ATPase
MYLVGIDGGGTKTKCLISDTKGNVLGAGRGGPGNYLKEGLMVVRLSLQEAISEAIANAGLKNPEVRVLCAGLAGMDRNEDKRVILRVLQEIAPSKTYRLENDAYIALKGATNGKPGVILISGTGSICLGENAAGGKARAGGWGHILGDEGSGYDIARRGLAAALKAFDGRGLKTLIEQKLKGQLYVRKTDDIVSNLYREGLTSSKIAGFYPIVQEAAQEGDNVALQIFEYAANELSQNIRAVVNRLKLAGEEFPISLVGGVLQGNRTLKEMLCQRIHQIAPRARITDPLHPPEVGALLLARETYGISNDERRMSNDG